MEISRIKHVLVKGSSCLGCQKFSKDVMVSLSTETEGKVDDFTDIFLTNEQAEKLIIQLQKALNDNRG